MLALVVLLTPSGPRKFSKLSTSMVCCEAVGLVTLTVTQACGLNVEGSSNNDLQVFVACSSGVTLTPHATTSASVFASLAVSSASAGIGGPLSEELARTEAELTSGL